MQANKHDGDHEGSDFQYVFDHGSDQQDQKSYNRADIRCTQLARKTRWKKPFYVKISLDGQKTFQTKFLKGDSELSWDETYYL